MIHLAIDTGTMRRHLFGGWALLTFVAARAREGRLQIYIPWVTHQEILTGIRDHVEDLTARKTLDTGLAEIAKGQADTSPLSALQLAAQQARERIYVDTKNKYEAWIASAQAEIVPLTIKQAKAAWDGYFAGTAPFRSPKSRRDLPDAFAFHALLELAARIGPVHFIVEDTPFRDACSRCSQIVCHKDVYSFCSSQGMAIDVKAETRLQKRELPLAELERNARSTLQDKVPGLTLRIPASAAAKVERLKIEAVRSVESFSFDANSVIHVEEDEYLVAFSARAVLQCDISDQRTIMSKSDTDETRAANYIAELRGHMLVRATAKAPKRQLSSDIDSVEVVSARLATNQETLIVVRPPEFVTDPWFEPYVEAITAPRRSGLVIVAGSKPLARRRLAEHLLRIKQRRDPDLGALYLMSYPPEFSNTLLHVKSSWGPFAETDLFQKATKTSARALALSVEEHAWLPYALEFICDEVGFVIATMKAATSVSAVVRELHSEGKDIALDRLLGVAIIKAADDSRIEFRAATSGEWGDGSWWGILEHDEYVGRFRSRSPL